MRITQLSAVLTLTIGAALGQAYAQADRLPVELAVVSETSQVSVDQEERVAASCRARSKARKFRNGTRCSDGQPIDPLRKIYLAVAVV